MSVRYFPSLNRLGASFLAVNTDLPPLVCLISFIYLFVNVRNHVLIYFKKVPEVKHPHLSTQILRLEVFKERACVSEAQGCAPGSQIALFLMLL